MICEKNKCTGCFACYNICSKKAIEMVEDDNGFIYPQINNDKCINCGLCKKVCPSINKIEKKEPHTCYATYTKDKKIRSKSTSGGIATTISKKVIKNGGIVYGASFTKDCNIEHIRVDNEENLKRLQGSKYVHSYINDTFKLVKKDLNENKKVLFFGTPCQIAGLRKYLQKEYENLYLIDIICHGVPSQKYLKEEVQRLVNTLNIERVNFRNNNQYGFYIVSNEKIINSNNISTSPYADAFMMGLSLRENCYNCIYAGSKRISDMTIGDFWGLSETSKFYEDRQNGVSVIAITNKKGEELFELVKDELNYEQRKYIEAVRGNTQLMEPAPKNKNADKFKNQYSKVGFEQAYKKVTRLRRLKRKIKKILKK